MEKLVIMGAGQFGRAAAALINRESFSVLAAADRDSRLWGSSMDRIPVMSPQEAMALNPDTLLISVSGRDRAEAMKSQAESLGFHGKIIFLDEMRRSLVPLSCSSADVPTIWEFQAVWRSWAYIKAILPGN